MVYYRHKDGGGREEEPGRSAKVQRATGSIGTAGREKEEKKMKKIEKHGVQMHGLRKVAGASKGLGGYYAGAYLEVFYDLSTGQVWGKYQYSLGANTWTVYNDPDVIRIGNIYEPCTMQGIADMIRNELERRAAVERGEIMPW